MAANESVLSDWFEDHESDDLLFDDASEPCDYSTELPFGADSDDDSDILMSDNPRREQVISQVDEYSAHNQPCSSRLRAMSMIESVFESIAEAVLDSKADMAISLARRPRSLQPVDSSSHSSRLDRKICFPGKTAQEAWQFTCYMRVLHLMHEALSNRVVTTKRDVYYKDPALFGKQAVVDRIIDDLAYTFDVPRSSLNVIAAAKGLAAGALTIQRAGSTILNGMQGEGCLIPILNRDDVISVIGAKCVLVVEKEAVFHSVVSSPGWTAMRSQAVLITGKGYPDIASRAMLRRLADPQQHDQVSKLDVLGLFDFDPDGIAIFSNYKFGSLAQSRENVSLTVPSSRWLGISSRDISRAQGESTKQGLLELSRRDRKKATSMLAWEHLGPGLDGGDLRRELQVMLCLNIKAEIQVLDSFDGGLDGWLKERLQPDEEADDLLDADTI